MMRPKTNDPEKIRAYLDYQAAMARRYRQKNRDKHRAAARDYARKHPEKTKARHKAYYESDAGRDRYLQKKYGISLTHYRDLERQQNGFCACCLRAPEGRLYVDHDHVNQKVRGLLCHQCNVALGLSRDRIETLEAMIAYLKRSL